MSHSKGSFPLTLMFVVSAIFLVAVVALMNRNAQSEPTTFPTPTDKPNNETAGLVFTPEGWQLFSDGPLGFSINYPTAVQFERSGDSSVLFTPTNQNSGQGEPSFVYVSVVTNADTGAAGTIYNYSRSHYEQLQKLSTGEQVDLSNGQQAEWFTYTRLPDTQIAGMSAKVFRNAKPWEFPNGTIETRYLIEENGELYILGYYAQQKTAGPFTQEVLNQMVESFQILDESSIML